MLNRPRSLVGLTLALFANLTGASELDEALSAKITPLLQSGAPGVSAAVLLPDGTLVQAAVGLADLDLEVELTADHRLLSGSVGKTYFAAALLHLAHTDRVDLNKPAIEYLDADAEWARRLPGTESITLRQLLRHRSGLARWVFAPAFTADLMAAPDRTWTAEDRLAYIFDEPALFEPGADFAYSDTNYIVIGMVIEAVTGRDAYTVVKELLLDPHELADTLPSNERRIPGLTQGHTSEDNPLGVPTRVLVNGVMAFNPQFEWCGGGFAGTPADLARWARIFYGGSAFEADYLTDVMDALPSPPLGPGTRYGAASMVRRTRLGESVGHDGFMPGYLTSMAWFPELEIAAAVQMNFDSAANIGRPLIHVLTDLVDAVQRARGD